MSLLIKKHGGNEYDIETIVDGLTFLELVNQPVINHNYTEIATVDGARYDYSTVGKSTITVSLLLKFKDQTDLEIKRSKLYGNLYAEPLQLRDTTQPRKIMVDVRLNAFNAEPQTTDDSVVFQLTFDNPSGFKRSDFESQNWQPSLYTDGMNLNKGENYYYQVRDNATFKIYNPSDVAIDPLKKHELKIVFKHTGVKFTLTNQTNGTTFTLNESGDKIQTYTLDGVNLFKGTNLDNINTDFGYISLEKGWNTFNVTNALNWEITFEFPFLYLN